MKLQYEMILEQQKDMAKVKDEEITSLKDLEVSTLQAHLSTVTQKVCSIYEIEL
jgi:hypothetical protein